jgi:membrane fusion protein (multidrug efflux system)
MKHNLLITLATLLLVFTACSPATTATPELIPTVIADSTIIAEGRVEPLRDAEIAFTAGGLVSEVLVKEGQTVKKGDLLIRLGGESDSNYAAAQYNVASAQKALNDLVKNSEADLAQAIIDLKEAKESLEKAEVYLDYLQRSKKVPQPETFVYYIKRGEGYDIRLRTHFYKGPAPANWIAKAEDEVALKKAEVEKLQDTVDRMKENGGVDSNELAILEAQLEAAKAELAVFEITAPFDGVVAEIDAKAGSSIRARDVAITLADFSNWLVKTTDLTEIDVVQLTENEPVVVTLDALPGVDFKGTILSIGQTYTENQGDVVYEVTVQLNEAHPAIRWGMTSSVTFRNQE